MVLLPSVHRIRLRLYSISFLFWSSLAPSLFAFHYCIYCQVLRKDSGSTTQGRIESMELSAMWDVQQHLHTSRGNEADFKILDFLLTIMTLWGLLISAVPTAVSVDHLWSFALVGVFGGLCRLCIFWGVGEEPTLSNEVILNMDRYDKCIWVWGHFQNRKNISDIGSITAS